MHSDFVPTLQASNVHLLLLSPSGAIFRRHRPHLVRLIFSDREMARPRITLLSKLQLVAEERKAHEPFKSAAFKRVQSPDIQ